MDDDPEYQLSFTKDSELAKDIPYTLLEEAVSATLIRHKVTRAQINIALVDDDKMASINESFLQHEGPTDVITFDLRDETLTHPDGASMASTPDDIDGEIVISVETAMRESKQREHSLMAEVALYAVHGTLHLLGFDDQTEEEAQRMHAMEDVILSAVGVGAVYGRSKT